MEQNYSYHTHLAYKTSSLQKNILKNIWFFFLKVKNVAAAKTITQLPKKFSFYWAIGFFFKSYIKIIINLLIYTIKSECLELTNRRSVVVTDYPCESKLAKFG